MYSTPGTSHSSCSIGRVTRCSTSAGEAPGKLYWYDEEGMRHEVTGEFPEMRSF